MDIGILGAGNIGATAARLFAEAGHRVAVSNSRGPETLASLVVELPEDVRALTAEEAAAFGEVVLEALPFGRYTSLPAEQLAGKILVTASNYYPERDGEIDLGGRASAELVAEHVAGARVVKAFNTIWYRHLADEGRPDAPDDERMVIFVAGDDPEAKATVSALISEIGFAAVDTGSLAASTRQEPDTSLYAKQMRRAEAEAAVAAASA